MQYDDSVLRLPGNFFILGEVNVIVIGFNGGDGMRVSRMIWIAGLVVLLGACVQNTIQSGLSDSELVAHRGLWEQQTGVPLFEGMGDHHHAISTRHPGAQRYFNQGLVLSFAYNHAESVRAFRAAQVLDDGCAMCFWGEALALGPNINVTYQGKAVMSDEARLQAHSALQKAMVLKVNASERERDYIDALARRYNGDLSTNRDLLDQDYMKAMRSLFEKYSGDDDAATLYAESMMVLMPWDYWIDPDTPKLLTAEVIRVLEQVLERSPRHPLGIHLYIHAVESSSTPERAEVAADILRDLVPGAGHLVHMPSHTYWRVGRYNDAAIANSRAVVVDESYITSCNAHGFYPAAYYPHNLHFLWAALSMEGRSREAIDTARKVTASVPDELIAQFPVVEFYKTIPVLSLSDFGHWQAILDEPLPSAQFVYSNAVWRYARALAQIKLNRPDVAQTEYQQLKAAIHDESIRELDALGYPASELLQIADKLISGELSAAKSQWKQAVADFEEAVAIQDALPYMEPPYWHYPVRHTLGQALMASGDYAGAESVYRVNQDNYPRNGRGLHGLMKSLEAQGKSYVEVNKAFLLAWQRADVVLEAPRF